jgi:hypothetical protein
MSEPRRLNCLAEGAIRIVLPLEFHIAPRSVSVVWAPDLDFRIRSICLFIFSPCGTHSFGSRFMTARRRTATVGSVTTPSMVDAPQAVYVTGGCRAETSPMKPPASV